MSCSVQVFRLVSNRSDPGLFCAEDELILGGVPLLTGTNSGLRPLPSGDLQRVFDAAYGADAAVDAVSRLSCLQSIARALNAGDLSYAAMLSLMLRLPDIDPGGMERLREVSSAAAVKYDDGESRDRRGRWTAGGTDTQAETTRPTAQSTTVHSTGHWPDTHRENPKIVPAQGTFPVPIFPPVFPGGPLNPLTPHKPKDDGIIYPAPDIPQTGTGQAANKNAAANARAIADDKPETCPDPSFEVDSVDRTPGQLLYQSQISGLAAGMGVRLNGVDFDGCRDSDGTMLEAKTTGPWFFIVPDFVFRTFDEYEKITDQAFRQIYASGSRKIEWHFSDPRVADFWKNEFSRLDFKITVRYTPFIPAVVKVLYITGQKS